MDDNRYCIEAKGLAKRFSGAAIFRNITFTVNAGALFCVTGKNGSGKSTLLKMLAGLMNPSEGEIAYYRLDRGSSIKEWPPAIGYTGPLVNPYDDLTALENIIFAAKNKMQDSQIDSLFDRFNLMEHRDKKIRYYSSGMKQRLRIILAVLNDPPLLLLDEPGTNLDDSGRDLLYSYLTMAQLKKTIILATNDRNEEKLCRGGILLD